MKPAQLLLEYQRLVERERALADIGTPMVGDLLREARVERRKRRRHAIQIFLFGLFAGVAGLVATALLLGPRP